MKITSQAQRLQIALSCFLLFAILAIGGGRYLYQETEYLADIFPAQCSISQERAVELVMRGTLGVLPMRPDFGRAQVRDANQIIAGQKYILKKGEHGKFVQVIEVTRAPYQNSRGQWMFEFKYPDIDLVEESFLSDNGVKPYKNGCWNATNHMLLLSNYI